VGEKRSGVHYVEGTIKEREAEGIRASQSSGIVDRIVYIDESEVEVGEWPMDVSLGKFDLLGHDVDALYLAGARK